MENVQKKQPRFKQIKPWIARDGSKRYYVNDWKEVIGLHVSKYNTGHTSAAYFDERGDGLGDISNHKYNVYVKDAKVWYDEKGTLHIDHLNSREVPGVDRRIMKYVNAKYKN